MLWYTALKTKTQKLGGGHEMLKLRVGKTAMCLLVCIVVFSMGLILGGGFETSVHAETVNIPVTADASVMAVSKYANYGADNNLYVRYFTTTNSNDRRVFIKVDCTSIDLARVTSAKLHLYFIERYTTSPDPITDIYGLQDDSWSESRTSYSKDLVNYPDVDGQPSEVGITGVLASCTMTNTAQYPNQWEVYDVTDFMKTQSDKILSFKLANNSRMSKYASKEATDSAVRPYLEVTLSDTLQPVTGVSLDYDQLTMLTGESRALTATIQPSNASNKLVTWNSSNPAVASVTNGIVTALSTGTTTITATTADGSFTDTCTVKTSKGRYMISEDAFTLKGSSSGDSTRNFGTGTTELYARNMNGGDSDRNIYMKVSCPDLMGVNVKSAKLFVYGFDLAASGNTPGKLNLFGLNDDSWTENRISYVSDGSSVDGPPSEVGMIKTGTMNFDTEGSWYSVDVTDFFNSQADRVLSFKLMGDPDSSSGIPFKFYSREYSDASKRPYLQIDSDFMVQPPQYSFKDSLGNPAGGFSDGGSVTITSTITTNTTNTTAKDITLICALYNKTTGELKDINFDRESFTGVNGQLTSSIGNLPTNASDYTIKCFFWDNMNKMQSLFSKDIYNP